MVGGLIGTMMGCGAASSNTSNSIIENNITALEKVTVLKAIATAFNDQQKKKTTFITDTSSIQSQSIQSQSEEKDPNSWDYIESDDLGVEKKETYYYGIKAYERTRDIGKNQVSEEVATFNTWIYKIDAENTDEYQKNELALYTSEFHSLVNTVSLDNVQTTTISRMNGTVIYTSGIEFKITNASVNSKMNLVDYSFTMSLSYPFVLKYDIDNNGTKESYSGTFLVTDMNPSSSTDYISATIANEDGVNYGQVHVYMDGRAKVIPSE